MKHKRRFLSIIMLALAGGLVACVPGTLPEENRMTVNLLNQLAMETTVSEVASQTSPPVLADPGHYVESIFPSAGPYILDDVEQTLLEANMLHRYEAGFYEPQAPVVIASSFQETLDLAMAEDGLSYDDIQIEFVNEAKSGLDKMPDDALVGVRTMAANSIVVSSETIEREAFEEAGMDMELQKRSIERMRELRRAIIDEQNRRKAGTP